MKRYLLPETGNYYKANLHCHSRISDGKLDIETIKRDYMAQGYSAVAFTDHEVFIPHNQLTDENFVALNGVEYGIGNGQKFGKTCHFCAVALDPDQTVQPCWHREKYIGCARYFRVMVDHDENEPDYVRAYTPEAISDMMRRVRDAGFFVTYNHPLWSRETAAEYCFYDGMHAMEICNNASRSTGGPEYCPMVYDEMLRAGKRIFCMATDDNHSAKIRFGGFVMIHAEKLEYRALTSALMRGDFYASQGPRIEELSYENGEIYARTSPAKRILFTFGLQRFARGEHGEEGKTVSEARAVVPPDAIYVRLTVEDAEGRHANSHAYFLDELETEKR